MDDIAIYNKSRELPGHMRPIVGRPVINYVIDHYRNYSKINISLLTLQHLFCASVVLITYIYSFEIVRFYMGEGWDYVAIYLPYGVSVVVLRICFSVDSYILHLENKSKLVSRSLFVSLIIKVCAFVMIYFLTSIDIISTFYIAHMHRYFHGECS